MQKETDIKGTELPILVNEMTSHASVVVITVGCPVIKGDWHMMILQLFNHLFMHKKISHGLHNATQYNTVQFNTQECKTRQYNVIQYNTEYYNKIEYNIIPQYYSIQ